MRIGLFLSCEEYAPEQLLAQAKQAAGSGFTGFAISDHFHPWLDDQGQSPFVWSMIGALSQAASLPVITLVTCPTTRMHPALVAQAAATSAVLTGGQFTLGVGTGEALNEAIMGQVWPPAPVRLEMLEEAVEVMRKLWDGHTVTHLGTHYTLHHAKLFTRPPQPPKVFMSAFGPKAVKLAGRIADGYISTKPDPELIEMFRAEGGQGKPVIGGAKGCYAATETEARKIAHSRWRNAGVEGELAQVLPTPEHFDQASALVTEDMMANAMVCGPDPQQHIDGLRKYEQAGFDEVYIAPVGPHYQQMLDLYATHVLPAFGAAPK